MLSSAQLKLQVSVHPVGDGRWYIKVCRHGKSVDGAGPFEDLSDAVLASRRIRQHYGDM